MKCDLASKQAPDAIGAPEGISAADRACEGAIRLVRPSADAVSLCAYDMTAIERCITGASA